MEGGREIVWYNIGPIHREREREREGEWEEREREREREKREKIVYFILHFKKNHFVIFNVNSYGCICNDICIWNKVMIIINE